MKLTPTIIRKLEEIEDGRRFYAIKSAAGNSEIPTEWFVFNGVFGLAFRNVMNTPHFARWREQAEDVSEELSEIFYHIHERGWRDIFLGSGLFNIAELVRLTAAEAREFERHGQMVIPFQTKTGAKYYVREDYFDVVDDLVEHMDVRIFRPAAPLNPRHYRPLVFLDRGIKVGMIHAIDEDNFHHPVDLQEVYRQEVQRGMPELLE